LAAGEHDIEVLQEEMCKQMQRVAGLTNQMVEVGEQFAGHVDLIEKNRQNGCKTHVGLGERIKVLEKHTTCPTGLQRQSRLDTLEKRELQTYNYAKLLSKRIDNEVGKFATRLNDLECSTSVNIKAQDDLGHELDERVHVLEVNKMFNDEVPIYAKEGTLLWAYAQMLEGKIIRNKKWAKGYFWREVDGKLVSKYFGVDKWQEVTNCLPEAWFGPDEWEVFESDANPRN
jgi:hypothetical protein